MAKSTSTPPTKPTKGKSAEESVKSNGAPVSGNNGSSGSETIPASGPLPKTAAPADAPAAKSKPGTGKAPATKSAVTPKASAAKPKASVTKNAVSPAAAAPSSEKPKAPPKKGKKPLPEQEEIDRMIAESAYYLAEKRNFEPGWEQEDWQTATDEVMSRLQDD